MKKLLPIVLCLFALTLSAQEPVPDETSGKGISPLNSSTSQPLNSSTYAVVVGISDYQDPGIPDLSYASEIQVLSCQHAPARPKVSTNHP